MIRKILKALFLILVCFGLAIFLAKPASASTLYFSPSKKEVSVGDVLKVSVRINTYGEAINAVSSQLSYPADLLDFAWISKSGSVLTIWANAAGGGGWVTIEGGLPTPGFTGDKSIATLGFKVKKTGTANLAFSANSHVVRNSDNSDSLDLAASGKGSYTLLLAPAASPTPEVTPSFLKIINPRVEKITTSSAQILWETDREASSVVEYGTQKEILSLTVGEEALTKFHSIALENLSPNTLFYYRLFSQDEQGTQVAGEIRSFKTLSLPITPLPPRALPKEKKLTQTLKYTLPLVVILFLLAISLVGFWYFKHRQRRQSHEF